MSFCQDVLQIYYQQVLLNQHKRLVFPIEDLKLAIASQTPLKAIPNNYVGLSFELGQTCSLVDRANNPTFLQILKNLGTDKVLRIGGRSSDLTDWQPDGTYSCNMTSDAVKTSTPTIVTKSLIDEIFQLAAKLHWKVIWTVDLGSNDPEKFADEVSYIESHYASMLIGLSIGSEPEIYQQYNIRPKNQTWGFDQYIAQWGAYRDAIFAVAPKASIDWTR